MTLQTSRSFKNMTDYTVSAAEITAGVVDSFDVFEVNLTKYGGQIVFNWIDHLNNGTMKLLQVTPSGDRVLLDSFFQTAPAQFNTLANAYFSGMNADYDETSQVVTGRIVLNYAPRYQEGMDEASTVEFFGCISYAGAT